MNAHLQRGWKLLEFRRYRESVEQFELARAFPEHLVSASLGLGWAWLGLGHPSKAVHHAKEALTHDPNLVDAYSILGKASLKKRKLKEAEKHFREALRLAPSHPDIHADLALLLLVKNQPKEADRQARLGLDHDPSNLSCRNILIRSLIEQRRHEESRKAAAETLAFHPDSVDAHSLAALAAISSEDFSAAKTHALEALRLDASSFEARELYIRSLKESYPVYSRLIRFGMKAGNLLRRPLLWGGMAIFPPCLVLYSILFFAFCLVADAMSAVVFALNQETRRLLTTEETRSAAWLAGGLIVIVLAFTAGFLIDRPDCIASGLAAVFMLRPIKVLFARLEADVRGWFFYTTILLGFTSTAIFLLHPFVGEKALGPYATGSYLGALFLSLLTLHPSLSSPPRRTENQS